MIARALALVVVLSSCTSSAPSFDGAAQLGDAAITSPHPSLVDGGTVAYDQAYGELLSAWSASCDEPFSRDLCPWPEDSTPPARAVDRCARLLSSSGSCDAAHAILVDCAP